MNSTNDKMKWYNWVMLINPLVSTIVVVTGWFFVNRYNVSRDIENKKREITTEYLINAFRAIEKQSGSSIVVLDNLLTISNEDIKRINDLEQAIADIQLFGDSYQRKQINKICSEVGTLKSFKIADLVVSGYHWEADNLLKDLRKKLRKELTLEDISSEEDEKGIQWLRLSTVIENKKK